MIYNNGDGVKSREERKQKIELKIIERQHREIYKKSFLTSNNPHHSRNHIWSSYSNKIMKIKFYLFIQNYQLLISYVPEGSQARGLLRSYQLVGQCYSKHQTKHCHSSTWPYLLCLLVKSFCSYHLDKPILEIHHS